MADITKGTIDIDAAIEVPWQLYVNAVGTLGAELLGGNPFVNVQRIDALMKRMKGCTHIMTIPGNMSPCGYEPKVVAAGVAYAAVSYVARQHSELHKESYAYWTAKLKVIQEGFHTDVTYTY